MRFIKTQLLISTIWISLYIFNGIFNNIIFYSSYIAIIFLPAGFKITIACLLGIRVFFGLFIGALVTAYLFLTKDMLHHAPIFAFLSALSPVITILLVKKFVPLGKKLEKLNIYTVLLIALIHSIINSFMHNTYLLLTDNINLEKFQSDTLFMFTGDLLGSIIFLFLLSYNRKIVYEFTRKYFMKNEE